MYLIEYFNERSSVYVCQRVAVLVADHKRSEMTMDITASAMQNIAMKFSDTNEPRNPAEYVPITSSKSGLRFYVLGHFSKFVCDSLFICVSVSDGYRLHIRDLCFFLIYLFLYIALYFISARMVSLL